MGPRPDGRYIVANPRRQPVVDLIRPITRTDPERAEQLRDEWMERVAIAEIDGELTPEEAEDVALRELRHRVRGSNICEREHGPSPSSQQEAGDGTPNVCGDAR